MTGPSARARPDTAAQMPSASRPGLAVGVHVADDRQRSRLAMAAAPTPMITRPAISQPTTAGDGAQHRSAAEDGDANQHDPLAPQEVTQHSRDEHEAGERQCVAVHHPLQRGDAGVQVTLDVGQADTDDRVVEEGEEKDGAERRQGQLLRDRTEAAFLNVKPRRRTPPREERLLGD